MKREREELHTRYAHEIEAAHSKLSKRESELCSLHSSALEDAKHQHLTCALHVLYLFTCTCIQYVPAAV